MNAMKGLDAEPSIDKEEAIEKAPKAKLSGVAAFMESLEEDKTRKGVGRYAARLRALSPKMAYALIDSRDEVRSRHALPFTLPTLMRHGIDFSFLLFQLTNACLGRLLDCSLHCECCMQAEMHT